MTPIFELLNKDAITLIVKQAKELLENFGVEIEAPEVFELMEQKGARVDEDNKRVFISPQMVDRSVESVPKEIILYDRSKKEAARIGDRNSYFVPGSSAINVFDAKSNAPRGSTRSDLDLLAKLVEQLPTFQIQSTSLSPVDVPAEIQDRVRLYHALRGCSKPIITGTFHEDGFEPMVRMLETVRGGSDELRKYPLAIFDCCSTPPLIWPRLTSMSLIGCAKRKIPTEIIPVPMCGATSPVTLHGALVQIVAENLSGVVINQAAGEGAPVIWGGCPMSFDMKFGTTPTGAPETLMLNAASAQIASTLKIPSHGYLVMSDSKVHDMQTGYESAMGAMSAALSGMNVVSGAGMMDFIRCFSFEKLLFDEQIILSAKRMRKGIQLHETDLCKLFKNAKEKGFLKNKHTRKNYREELSIADELIDRNAQDTGKCTFERCTERLEKLLSNPTLAPLDPKIESELTAINNAELSRVGFA